MNRLSDKELKELAKSRGIRGYQRLRRNQLIDLLNAPILDRDNEIINTPVLRPTIAPPPMPSAPPTAPPTRQQTVEDLLRSLERVENVPKSTSPELNALKNKIKELYSKVDQIKVQKHRLALKMLAEENKIPGITVSSPEEFLELTRRVIIEILRSKRNTKVKIVLQCLMYRFDDVDVPVEANFSSEINEINLEGTDVDELYNIMVERILENYANFLRKGSGWAFHSVVHLKLHTVIYEPLRGTGYIELPDWISDKKACINPKNYDNQCVLWKILRALNPKEKNAERIDRDLRSRENSLNMEGIEYPVTPHDIDKFEKQNPEISVNVHSYDEKRKFYPLRITKNEKKNHVDSLYFTNGINNHYAIIKNFSHLMGSQISKNEKKKYFCKRCLNPFGSEELLEKQKILLRSRARFFKNARRGKRITIYKSR